MQLPSIPYCKFHMAQNQKRMLKNPISYQIWMKWQSQRKISRGSQEPARALPQQLVLEEGFRESIEGEPSVQHQWDKENQHFFYAATVPTFLHEFRFFVKINILKNRGLSRLNKGIKARSFTSQHPKEVANISHGIFRNVPCYAPSEQVYSPFSYSKPMC